jgi:4-amino-4-deoxy-L-arabinose transferase-like glycosyltransferase
MTLTLVGFLLAQSNPQEYRRWMLLAWAGAAGALMSKGLMGFILPGAVFVLYSLIQRDPGIWTRLNFWAGLIVFLMLGAPWFILVSMANPEFVEFFFIHEHFNRFFTKVHQRYEPWYYFLAYTALAILPWIPQLTGLLKNTLKAILPLDKSRFNPELFLLIWAVFIVFFFSISSSKLPHYIMPVMPAIALLYARYFDNDEVPHLSISALITLIIGVGGMGISFINNPKLLQFSDWLPWMRVGFVILIIGGATTLFLRHASAFKRIAVLCISWYLTTLIILASAQSVSEIRSAWPLLKDHAHKIQPEDPVYSVEYYQQTVPFYLGRTVTLVNYMGELEFGIHQEPEKYIPSTETFKELWLADDRAFAVMKLEVYEPLATEGLPMKELSRDRKFILVEKP